MRTTAENREVYQQLLKDYRWLKKRKKILAGAMHLCLNCKTEARLEVHHLYYVYGYSPWEYPDKALIALCNSCHKQWHDEYKVEFRSNIWGKNKPYTPPSWDHNKSTKKKKLGCSRRVLTPLEKAKVKARSRGRKGTSGFSFAPIPEWRQKQK